MAGAGFKTFTVGEVLTSSDVNTYLMQQAVMAFASSGARGSAIGTATEGMVSYLADTDAVEVYDGSAWTSIGLPLGTATPADGDTLTYGTATSTWNPSPAGKVLQVVSTTKADTFSASLAAGAATDVTGLSVSITPTSATNKVLVVAVVDAGSSLSGLGGYINVLRDSTQVGGGTAAGSRVSSNASFVADTGYAGRNSMTALFLDSPATTSATTYKVQVRNGSNDTRTIYVNRSHDDQNATWMARTASSITVVEVAA